MSDVMNIIRLPQNQYIADVRNFMETRRRKREHDRESRSCETVLKSLRALLFQAMQGAPVARCGNYVITIKPEKRNPGALTLKDGRSIPLSDIDEIVINGGSDVIRASDVKTWYGGATVGADLDIIAIGDE